MIYREISGKDLFTVSKNYALAHCISSDFALGAGIAKQFTALGVRDELRSNHKPEWDGNGYAVITNATDWRCEINLVTKERYYHKPTLKTLTQALYDAGLTICQYNENADNPITAIAMPCIGCGLDRLEWKDVKRVITAIFGNYDIEILVCMR